MKKLAVVIGLVWVLGGQAYAATITQLNITGGSLSLDFGSQGSVAGTFTQNGTLLMGQYQVPPTLLPPFVVDGHTFTYFTSNFNGAPPPSGEITGTTINVNLSSLFTLAEGPTLNGALDIGGLASGTFNPETGAFKISWVRLYPSTPPFLNFGQFDLEGTGPAPIPIPATFWLFATGVGAIVAALRHARGGRGTENRAER
jgi:hypothetical protein